MKTKKSRRNRGLAVLEMLKRAHLEFCSWCGKELGYDVPISQWGGRNYHPECLTKILSIGDGGVA